MASPERVRAFLIALLDAWGARVETSDPERVIARLPAECAAVFGGRDRLEMVFTPEALQAHPEAELLAPGSALLDAAIGLARRHGAAARRFLAYPPPPAALAERFPHAFSLRSGEVSLAEVTDSYRPYLLAHFKVAFVSDEVREELRVSALRLEDGSLASPELTAQLESTAIARPGEQSCRSWEGEAPAEPSAARYAARQAPRPPGSILVQARGMPPLPVNGSAPGTSMPLKEAMARLAEEVRAALGPAMAAARADAEKRLQAERARLEEYYQALHGEAALRSGDPQIRDRQRSRDRQAAATERIRRKYALVREIASSGEPSSERSLLAFRGGAGASAWRERRRALDARREDLRARQRGAVFGSAEWKELARRITEGEGEAKLLTEAEALWNELRRAHPKADAAKRLAAVDRRQELELERLAERYQRSEEPAQAHPEALARELDRLDAEQALRLEELAEKHQVKVVVSPVLAALVFEPVRFYRVACQPAASVPAPAISVYEEPAAPSPVSSPRSPVEVVLPYLLRTQAPEPVPCRQCGGALGEGSVLCKGGHIVCAACGLRCAHCGEEFCAAHGTPACAACGQPVCPECSAKCAGCGQSVCREHQAACPECGAAVCAGPSGGCAHPCACCGRPFCARHVAPCPACGQLVCAEDGEPCPTCGEKTCLACRPPCPGCGRRSCARHWKACALCGQEHCVSCLEGEGLCVACAGLFPAPKSAEVLAAVVGARDPAAANARHWWLAENHERFVALGGGRWTGWAVVLDRDHAAVRSSRRLGWWEWARVRRRLSRS